MVLQRTLGLYAMISLPIVRDMTVDHVAGLAFGGQRPHSSEEHVQGPNALILHSMKVSPDHNIATYNVYVLGSPYPILANRKNVLFCIYCVFVSINVR